MVVISNKAQEKIREILEAENKSGWGLRLGVRGGGCSGFTYSMDFDQQKAEHDQVLDFEGFNVWIDAKSMVYLAGTEVDYTEGLNGAGFVFNNPNVTRSCGCGNSFAV